VYVLANEGMPGALKIGSTTRNPFTRAKELQTTGVPHPFVVVAAVRVNDVKVVEKAVHHELSRRALRIKGDREFFSVDVAEVLRVVAALCDGDGEVGGVTAQARTGDDALLDAIAFRDGVGNQPPDMKKAVLAFEEAAALGCRRADYVLMQLYDGGGEVRRSNSKRLFYSRRVDQHIRDLSQTAEGILELALMYNDPSGERREGRFAYEHAMSTMFRNKNYKAGLLMVDMIVDEYGYEESLLEAIHDSAYYLDDRTKKILEEKMQSWVTIDEICQYIISKINDIIDNRSIYGSREYAPFRYDAMTFSQFNISSMFGYTFDSVMRNLRCWSCSILAARPKIEGQGIDALHEWIYAPQPDQS